MHILLYRTINYSEMNAEKIFMTEMQPQSFLTNNISLQIRLCIYVLGQTGVVWKRVGFQDLGRPTLGLTLVPFGIHTTRVSFSHYLVVL